jgi:hypothetical protein
MRMIDPGVLVNHGLVAFAQNSVKKIEIGSVFESPRQ